MFISIDPGKNVGVATFREDGSDISRTVMQLPEFRIFLGNIYQYAAEDPANTVKFIMEDYTLIQSMAIAQTGSDMPASRAIGAVEQIHTMLGDKSLVFKVRPGELRSALKWAGFPELANKPRTWHCPDELSAYAHGVKFLIDKNIRRHPIFDSE